MENEENAKELISWGVLRLKSEMEDISDKENHEYLNLVGKRYPSYHDSLGECKSLFTVFAQTQKIIVFS